MGVQKIIATDSNIRAAGIAGHGIGAWGKGGVNKWYYRSICMCFFERIVYLILFIQITYCCLYILQ